MCIPQNIFLKINQKKAIKKLATTTKYENDLKPTMRRDLFSSLGVAGVNG